MYRHHYAFNTERNPKSHVQPIDLSSFVIVMTRHDNRRIQGQLMGLMNSTSLDDLIQTNEAVLTDELTRCLWRINEAFKFVIYLPEYATLCTLFYIILCEFWELLISNYWLYWGFTMKSFIYENNPSWRMFHILNSLSSII